MPPRPKHNRRLSAPSNYSSYPASPSITNDRASSVFPYSTARPPTDYSQHSWVGGGAHPPLPPHPTYSIHGTNLPNATNPFDHPSDRGQRVSEHTEVYDERETPVYVRSDCGETTEAGHEHGIGHEPATAWTQSSWTGPATSRTAAPLLGFIDEEEGYDTVPRPVTFVASPQSIEHRGTPRDSAFNQGYGQGQYGQQYGHQRRSSFAGAPSPVPIPPASHSPPYQPRRHNSAHLVRRFTNTRRSTYPSILDLGHLVNPHHNGGGVSHVPPLPTAPLPTAQVHEPFADPRPERGSFGSNGPNFLHPEQQHQLGRMSVAPPRYPVPPSSARKRPTAPARSAMVVHYLTWRPFVTAALSLITAVLLTVSASGGSSTSSLAIVPEGAFVKSVSDTAMALGATGWCQSGVSDPTCQTYQAGDFGTVDSSYTIPGSLLLSTIASLLFGLVALAWLLAFYLTVTAFLHFYLFFALSIPFNHLAAPGDADRTGVEAEVDIRARCWHEPYTGYEWVWWAWWGHRRGPVGHIFATLVGALGLGVVIASVVFVHNVSSATGASASYGEGSFVGLIAFLCTLDPFVTGVRYLSSFPKSWKSFNHPPDPSPSAYLLPPSSEKMQHVRHGAGQSFFAPPRATVMPGPDASASSLDPETVRWLASYPSDPELVPLIADLRTGGDNDDFILSDVGLLYLRPESDEPALLVPPRGAVRDEIIDEAHYDESGGHVGANDMVQALLATFWWMSIEADAHAFVARCPVCQRAGTGVDAVANEEGVGSEEQSQGETMYEPKTGWTEVPYTGVTGLTGLTKAPMDSAWQEGQSAMAADMAFAMRRADEEAKGGW